MGRLVVANLDGKVFGFQCSVLRLFRYRFSVGPRLRDDSGTRPEHGSLNTGFTPATWRCPNKNRYHVYAS